MNDQVEKLNQIETQALEHLESVTSLEQLQAWRHQYLGRKGIVPQLLRTVKDLPALQRQQVGQRGNELRQKLEQLYQERQASLEPDGIPLGQSKQDKTAPTSPIPPHGHLHPLSRTIRKIQDIFAGMGFLLVEGPEVEEARYNFDLLNIPLEHPAREETDTFYVRDDLVLRTHTSPVQIRASLEQNLTPPFQILSPGRVFRAERTDATHETTFYQFEGLVIAKHITIADFKGTIEFFYSAFFGKDVKSRLRPTFFPFVEPGFEVDLSCVFCQQKGCRVCKYTGWIEVMGAGMVHPNVLRNMNVDSSLWQGYAFGGAVDRLTMLQHGIDDIRLFWSNNLQFLQQF